MPALRQYGFAAIAFLAVAVLLSTAIRAEGCVPRDQFLRMSPGFTWTRFPDVTVLGHEDDPRVQMVRDSVAYWNAGLKRLAIGFRLGRVRVGPLPDGVEDFTVAVGEGVLDRSFRAPRDLPSGLNLRCGTIVVVLTERDLISFGRPIYRRGFALVGIKANDAYPFTRKNVARNVIAHEIGHAIGVRHNADPASLMCGRPASCRPTLFESSRRHFFPLTAVVDSELRAAYGP